RRGAVKNRKPRRLPSGPAGTILHAHATGQAPSAQGAAIMAARKVRVAIVGLGFGAEFIPIYQAHPDAEMYAVCRRNRKELDACGDRFGIKARYTDYNEMLRDPDVD